MISIACQPFVKLMLSSHYLESLQHDHFRQNMIVIAFLVERAYVYISGFIWGVTALHIFALYISLKKRICYNENFWGFIHSSFKRKILRCLSATLSFTLIHTNSNKINIFELLYSMPIGLNYKFVHCGTHICKSFSLHFLEIRLF